MMSDKTNLCYTVCTTCHYPASANYSTLCYLCDLTIVTKLRRNQIIPLPPAVYRHMILSPLYQFP